MIKKFPQTWSRNLHAIDSDDRQIRCLAVFAACNDGNLVVDTSDVPVPAIQVSGHARFGKCRSVPSPQCQFLAKNPLERLARSS
jgi:hypothetical protein